MVTGASSGLGAEFARQLADAGHDLILVARGKDGLEAVAADVRERGREAQVVVADLSVDADVDRVAAMLEDEARPVEVLVNNAGYALRAGFVRSDVASEKALLDVMVRSVMVLCHAAARAMKARGSGGILNVASVASFLLSGPYSAHKAWVKVFSEALAGSLHGTGVHVTVTTPGLVRTDFHRRAELDYSRLPGWVWTPPAPVVRASLRALRRGRPLVTPTARYKVMSGALRLIPRPIVRRASRR